jgi:hypothetical protein
MKVLFRVLVTLPAILFIVTGLRWAIDPSGAATALGMTLLDGIGRSSQIGDVGAMFLSMGFMMLIALVTAKRTWFYAPALLLSLIAVFRLLAWLVHGAALAMDMIVVELVVAGILLIAASKLSPKE